MLVTSYKPRYHLKRHSPSTHFSFLALQNQSRNQHSLVELRIHLSSALSAVALCQEQPCFWIHELQRATSACVTVRRVFSMAALRSSLDTGASSSERLRRRIWSGLLPAILRRIVIIAASLRKEVFFCSNKRHKYLPTAIS